MRNSDPRTNTIDIKSLRTMIKDLKINKLFEIVVERAKYYFKFRERPVRICR